MFSKVTSNLLKKQVFRTQKSLAITQFGQRGFMERLGLESHLKEAVTTGKEGVELELWRNFDNSSNALTLKNHDEIAKYVLKISRDYFRTTKKAKLDLDSHYKQHGLDTYDLIELIIQVEDDLGYIIDAENLEKFQKPKHFVNYIKQIEAYKEEFGKLPFSTEKATFDFKKAFPTSGGGH